VVAFGDNSEGQCDVPSPSLDGSDVRYIAPLADSYLVITLMLRHEDIDSHIIACISMSGDSA